MLNQQRLIKYRFPDINDRLYRATVGFRALGDIGEPAIPDLLALVEANPGYIPGALAGIGRPAVPALQQCLTNTTLYTNSLGIYAIIPGNTIVDIGNATSRGVFSKSDIAVFVPAVEAWAQQTTNRQAQTKAQGFLKSTTKCSDGVEKSGACMEQNPIGPHVKKWPLTMLAGAQRDGAAELVIEPAPGGGTVYRYMGQSSAPSNMLQWAVAVSELAGLAGVRDAPYPTEGIIYVAYSGVRLRWRFKMANEGSECVLYNLGDDPI